MGRGQWEAELPRVVDGLARRWSLRLGEPFAGGSASWVAPARTTAGDLVVLKVGWPHDEALHEADGLRVWDGRGTVRLLAADVSGRASVLLTEACEPGTTLAAALPADEQDMVVAGLLRRLWIEPGAGHPFRPLREMCEKWAAEFEQDYAAARAAGRDRAVPPAPGGGRPVRAALHGPAPRQRARRPARAVAGDRPETVYRRPLLRRPAAHAELSRPAQHRSGRLRRADGRAGRPRSRPGQAVALRAVRAGIR